MADGDIWRGSCPKWDLSRPGGRGGNAGHSNEQCHDQSDGDWHNNEDVAFHMDAPVSCVGVQDEHIHCPMDMFVLDADARNRSIHMKRNVFVVMPITITLVMALLIAVSGVPTTTARAGQVPFGTAASPDIPISHRDRVYTADQWSNTVSVTDPVDNKLLGVIRLGETTPANLSPLYSGQVLVHGMGFSPDHRTLLVASISSNAVAFIDTATNAVKHITYVQRPPHEPFYTPY